MTLTSKNRCHSLSEICSNGFGSKIPRLFTSTSTSGKRRTTSSTPAVVPRSAAIPSTFAPAVCERICLIATLTRSAVRPFTMTRTPSRASPFTIAKPIPAVEPETSASLFFSWRSIRRQRNHPQITQIQTNYVVEPVVPSAPASYRRAVQFPVSD